MSADALYFSEENSVATVNARMAATVDPRLREVMSALVRHLHAAVKEVSLTQEEWLAGIEFLSATGRMCTDWRQEFILLSDVLGVSMLVDAINHRRADAATENTVLGPFHVAQAPQYASGANICLDGRGEPMVLRGRVVDTHGKPIPGASIDTWQCNDEGFYDVQQKGVQPRWNLRGRFTADADGRFWYRAVKPRHYPIPNDGPVGQLLEKLGRHPNRAAHIHFIVSAPGHSTATTHVFTPDCPYLAEDAVFGVKSSLIGDFVHVTDAQQAAGFGVAAPFWLVDWEFVLEPSSAEASA